MLLNELDQLIRRRTGSLVEDLSIEVASERVVLRGEATSFYVKQLAQEAVRERLPRVRIHNAILVKSRRNHLVIAEAS